MYQNESTILISMNMKKIFFAIVSFIFFTSCDTYLHLTGTVVDASNEMPIDSVCVSLRAEKGWYLYTDSLGQFNIDVMSFGGFLGVAPRTHIKLEKEGYRSRKKSYPHWKEKPVVIRLRRR